MPRWMTTLTCLLVLITALAHALAVVSLIAFGLRADGWVLHPLAVAWHGLFVLGSLVVLLRTWRDPASPWLLVIPPLLTLAALGAIPATGVLGVTRYAPYDPFDTQEGFLAFNFLSGLALVMLALIYRWPRLLLAWVVAQGLLLITYPGWWAELWSPGYMIILGVTGILTLGLSPLYVLAALALNLRPPRGWGHWVLAGLVIGVVLAVLAGIRDVPHISNQGYLPETASELSKLWLSITVQLPALLAFGVVLLPLVLLAGRLLRTEPEAVARRFPWEALPLVLLAAASVAPSALLPAPAGMLPAAGSIQGWRSSDHVVPDAWLPTVTWVGWLFLAVRWLVLPYALLGLIVTLRQGMRPRWALPAFPHVLLWAGLGWLAAYIWDFSPLSFPLRVAWETYSPAADALPLLGGLGLLLAGRVWERGWGRLGDGFWRLITFGGLGLLLLWVGQGAWVYGRALFAPLPAWVEDWQYTPLPWIPSPIPLISLGLALHLTSLALGLFALGRTLHAWWQAGMALKRVASIGLPLLVLTALGLLWWWATAPGVVRTVPPNGASNVPRDTVILIEMGPEKRWPGLLLGGSGGGMRVRYADTGNPIPGMSGFGGPGFLFDPEEPLRPNAPVEVIAHRTGERPYTLRFTTAGIGGPTATPMPEPVDWPGPLPTAAPTQALSITPVPAMLLERGP